MITPATLAESLSRNVEIVKLQAAGMTQVESLIQLPFRANCMNWVLGHLVTNRNSILKLLDREDLIDATSMTRYERESEPITGPGDGVLAVEELIHLLEQAQSHIQRVLSEITQEELGCQVAFFGNRSMSVAEWLFFFYFHDTYHTGQTEILRQAAGKNDKVI
jgi:uncharacterized damage-inducible protein DinB